MGSHAKYDSRIPDDWPYLSLPGADETENDYATTVDYTDYVLKNIFNYSKENLHMTAMAYLSDHGEDMTYGHGGGHITWQMLHIPFSFICLLHTSRNIRILPEFFVLMKRKFSRMIFSLIP